MTTLNYRSSILGVTIIAVLQLFVGVELISKPVFALEGSTTIDLGIMHPEDFYHTIHFFNSGSDTLKMLEVAVSKGLSYTPFKQREFGPGEAGELYVHNVNTTFSGPYTWRVRFKTNDPEQEEVNISINVVFDKHLVVSPVKFPIKSVVLGKSYTGSVEIMNVSASTIVLSNPVLLDDQIASCTFAMPDEVSLEAGESFTFVAEIEPLVSGWRRGLVELDTSSPIKPKLQIRFVFQAREELIPGAASAKE